MRLLLPGREDVHRTRCQGGSTGNFPNICSALACRARALLEAASIAELCATHTPHAVAALRPRHDDMAIGAGTRVRSQPLPEHWILQIVLHLLEVVYVLKCLVAVEDLFTEQGLQVMVPKDVRTTDRRTLDA